MNMDLSTETSIRAAVDSLAASMAASYSQLWFKELPAFLTKVQAGLPSRLQDRNFLELLWENESVSSTGMGSVKVAPALDNAEFRKWFEEQVQSTLKSIPVELETHLTNLYTELEKRLLELCGRVPRLKLNRVLCAIFPDHFTTIADVGKLKVLHRAMGGSQKDHPVHIHSFIRQRLDSVLGPVPEGDSNATIQRLCLAWFLYEHVVAESSDIAAIPQTPIDGGLKSLPVMLRRKGLTAMKGSFPALLNLVQVLQEGLTREEFTDAIRQANPDLADNSIGTVINSVAREFDLCSRDGTIYRLSARGLNLLNSRDPDELTDHLLTRILGIDNVIYHLKGGAQSKLDLLSLLQKVNPGWTSNFAPSSLLGWLVSLDVIEPIEPKRYQLTQRGQRWADMLSWEPECLPTPADILDTKLESIKHDVEISDFKALEGRLQQLVLGKLIYKPELVQQLHAGLWFHPIRHFVVLTGISGSGKTQLALNYSMALCGVQNNDHENVRIIPVQPGWFDPSPLLGYVNPITQTYRNAPFLELMLRAADDPTHPYVAILDEMNLSHPEQYLSPVLSAMETRGWIDLHQLSGGATDVPQKVQYPANLAIIGTLNMDETTHGLSDKVLDRAYTLEFWDINVADFPLWATSQLSEGIKNRAKRVLEGLGASLAPVRLHFGWRTIDDVLRYVEFFSGLGTTTADPLDAAIFAKVLPKLRGENTARFQAALEATYQLLEQEGLDRSAKKIVELKTDLLETGTARFWR